MARFARGHFTAQLDTPAFSPEPVPTHIEVVLWEDENARSDLAWHDRGKALAHEQDRLQLVLVSARVVMDYGECLASELEAEPLEVWCSHKELGGHPQIKQAARPHVMGLLRRLRERGFDPDDCATWRVTLVNQLASTATGQLRP